MNRDVQQELCTQAMAWYVHETKLLPSAECSGRLQTHYNSTWGCQNGRLMTRRQPSPPAQSGKLSFSSESLVGQRVLVWPEHSDETWRPAICRRHFTAFPTDWASPVLWKLVAFLLQWDQSCSLWWCKASLLQSPTETQETAQSQNKNTYHQLCV